LLSQMAFCQYIPLFADTPIVQWHPHYWPDGVAY